LNVVVSKSRKTEGEMKLFKLPGLTVVTLALLVQSCGGIQAQSGFDRSRWSAAAPEERRRMADDFLANHYTKGSTLESIKQQLGEHDFEYDPWIYAIGTNDAKYFKSMPSSPPIEAGLKDDRAVARKLKLYVQFKQGRVSELHLNYSVRLSEDRVFESEKWKTSKALERLRMTASLINSREALGKTKQELSHLLGEPDRKSKNLEIGYDLGRRIIDNVYLTFIVTFSGEVVEARIQEH
jgi:hypothetical protein